MLGERASNINSPLKIFSLIIWPYFINDLFIIYGDLYQKTWVIYADEFLYLVVPLITIIWLNTKANISLRGLGWPAGADIVQEEVYAILYFIGYYFIILKGLAEALTGFFRGNPELQLWQFQRAADNAEAINWPLIVLYSVSAGIYEETIFRGLYTKLFREHFSKKWLFYGFGATIFAAIHWSNGPLNILHTFLWGLAALIIYNYRPKLLSLILMHSAYDFVMFAGLHK